MEFNVPAFESLASELNKIDEEKPVVRTMEKVAHNADEDDDAGSITAMMQNLQLSALLKTDYFEPIEKPQARTLQKVTVPETSYTPSNPIRPAKNSPLAKRAYSPEMQNGIAGWMRHEMASGETVSSLAELFKISDPEYSQLILELGARL